MEKRNKRIYCSVDARPYSTKLLQALEDGYIGAEEVLNECIQYLSDNEVEDIYRTLGLDEVFDIEGATEPDATYQNRRNPNKFIETKKYKDGHRVARQYMEWDTPNGTVRNYNGAKDAKRGRYFRTRKNTLDEMLEDYDEVESCGYTESITSSTQLGTMSKYFKVAKPAEYDGLIADGPDEEAEYMEWVDSQLAEDDATFNGWAIAKARYYDKLADAGMELAIIGQHSDGSNSLYWSTGDHLYEIDESDISRELR